MSPDYDYEREKRHADEVTAKLAGRPSSLAPAPGSAPSRLWKHMAETHNLPLLESEENDIRWAVSEEQQRRIAALEAVLVVRENEIERLKKAGANLRSIGEGFFTRSQVAAWDSIFPPKPRANRVGSGDWLDSSDGYAS